MGGRDGGRRMAALVDGRAGKHRRAALPGIKAAPERSENITGRQAVVLPSAASMYNRLQSIPHSRTARARKGAH